ncbi:MAG: hypothetical protein OIF40_16525 [Mangrovicoccus sp.]|nr:hypothetical protein [Mangrovicoccus sp.]
MPRSIGHISHRMPRRAQVADQDAARFLEVKAAALLDRSARLSRLSPARAGLRLSDKRYSPAAAYFDAANKRLAQIDTAIAQKRALLKAPQGHDLRRKLLHLALVEREVDRARRTFGLFFEVFAQRGTSFAPALAAHDAIAGDCYRAVLHDEASLLQRPLLMPLTYMEHGYSPATMRRGVTLKRLLGEPNPFPLIRIPWDRDRPWQSTFLHEVAHNLQADLGIWEETKQAVQRRLQQTGLSPHQQKTWAHWHKEVFADLAAILLGGPVAAFGLAEFLAHPPAKVTIFKEGAVHPVGFIRVLILAEMLRRMGFKADANRLSKIWKRLYGADAAQRLPEALQAAIPVAVPLMVDEIAYQPRRMLAQRGLTDLIRFAPTDQARIELGGRAFAAGKIPDLPPRWLIGAARLAIAQGAPAARIGQVLTKRLAQIAAQNRSVRLGRSHLAASSKAAHRARTKPARRLDLSLNWAA